MDKTKPERADGEVRPDTVDGWPVRYREDGVPVVDGSRLPVGAVLEVVIGPAAHRFDVQVDELDGQPVGYVAGGRLAMEMATGAIKHASLGWQP